VIISNNRVIEKSPFLESNKLQADRGLGLFHFLLFEYELALCECNNRKELLYDHIYDQYG